MVEVFYAPVLPNDPRNLSYCFSVGCMGCSKQADGHLGFRSFFCRAVNPSAFNDLGNMREGADLGVYWDNSDVAHFIPSVSLLQFSNQTYRTSLEKFFGVFKIVFLVFLNRRQAFTSIFID